MNQLITTAIITALTISAVAAVVIFLIWRSPFLKPRSKWVASIAVGILALLLAAGITYGFNKYVLGTNPKIAKKFNKEPKGDFLYGYDVLHVNRGSKSVSVAILVSDRITKKDLQREIGLAARDFGSPGRVVEVLAFSKRVANFVSGQDGFVCKVTGNPGSLKWSWNRNLNLPTERAKF